MHYIETMNIFKHIIIFKIALTISLTNLYAKKEPEELDFLQKVYNGSEQLKKRLIIKSDTKKILKKIMGERYRKAIFSYWIIDDKTVWILNSIGKYKPITAGFVIKDCKIESAHVLIYREQIGYEIKYPSFLSQFNGITLRKDVKLNKYLDNISGATLSVNSMDRMGRVALLLNSLVDEKKCN